MARYAAALRRCGYGVVSVLHRCHAWRWSKVPFLARPLAARRPTQASVSSALRHNNEKVPHCPEGNTRKQLDKGVVPYYYLGASTAVYIAVGNHAVSAIAATARCHCVEMDHFRGIHGGLGIPVSVFWLLPSLSCHKALEGQGGTKVSFLCLVGAARQDPHHGKFGD